MTLDDEPDRPCLGDALARACRTADWALSTVVAIWKSLTPGEQEAWLEDAPIFWPKCDVMLPAILAADERIGADLNAANEEEAES
jgi:hypothetical protein